MDDIPRRQYGKSVQRFLVDMQLKAISKGPRVPGGAYNVLVHSVFARAVNVSLPDGRLVTLLDAAFGNTPHGVRVILPDGFDFSDRLTVNDAGACRGGVLRMGQLSVRLSRAETWNGRLAVLRTGLASEAVFRAWRRAWNTAWSDSRNHWRERTADRSDGAVRFSNLTALLRAAENGNAHATAAAVKGVIGAGPGLTPASDDFIVGLLAGITVSLDGSALRKRIHQTVARAAAASADKTTAVSRAYLTAAGDGDFGEVLCAFAQSFDSGERDCAVEAALHRMLKVGHSSGLDGALGLLCGLGLWHKPAFDHILSDVSSRQDSLVL